MIGRKLGKIINQPFCTTSFTSKIPQLSFTESKAAGLSL